MQHIKSHRKKCILLFILANMLCLLFFFFIACATRNAQYINTDAFVKDQNFSAARQEIEANKNSLYPSEDIILYYLDDGVLAFYEGENKESISQLSIADRLMEDAYTKSISQEILSFIINDTVKEYAGNYHERIFTNIFLALNYLQQNNFDDGFVEIKKALNIIQKIQNDNGILYDSYKQSDDSYVPLDEYKTPIIDSAFVRLVSSWVYRADRDISNYEVSLRNYNNAINSQPHLYSSFSPPAYTPEQGYELLSKYEESANVQIIAFTGRVPIKVEKGFSVNTVDGTAIVHAHDEETTLSEYNIIQSNNNSALTAIIKVPDGISFSAKFSLPHLAKYNSNVKKVEVYIDSTIVGHLKKTEDIATIAQAIFESEQNFIYSKTISRVLSKAILSATTTAVASQTDSRIGAIASIAGGLFNNFSEQADIRSARYYPGVIWTGDFLFPDFDLEKEYTVTLVYLNASGKELYRDEKNTNLDPTFSQLNLVSSVFLH